MPDVLLDTVTFVDYLTDRSRLDPEALQWIEGAEQEHSLLISAVTIMQLVEMRTAGTLSGEARWARASCVNILARWRRFMMRYIVHARVDAG